jgi:gluconate kinase
MLTLLLLSKIGKRYNLWKDERHEWKEIITEPLRQAMDKSIGKMLVIMLLLHSNILLHYRRGGCSGMVLDSTVKNHYCVRMQEVQPSLQILYLKSSPSLFNQRKLQSYITFYGNSGRYS